MFDPPSYNAYNSLSYRDAESPAHSELARKAAQKAICLYQNRAAAGKDHDEAGSRSPGSGPDAAGAAS